jgi:hypothetical protein
MKEFFLVCHLPVCMCVHVNALLPHEHLDGLCSIFKSLSIIGQCLVSTNIQAPKNWFLRGVSEQNDSFLENSCNDLIKFSTIHGDELAK